MTQKLCTKCKKYEGNILHAGICNVCYSNALFGDASKYENSSPNIPTKGKKDDSMKTGVTVMIVCGIIGLLAGGLGGAVLGAAFGFSITVFVMSAKEGTKDL
jgi:hypothetical protein